MCVCLFLCIAYMFDSFIGVEEEKDLKSVKIDDCNEKNRIFAGDDYVMTIDSNFVCEIVSLRGEFRYTDKFVEVEVYGDKFKRFKVWLCRDLEDLNVVRVCSFRKFRDNVRDIDVDSIMIDNINFKK